MLFFDELLSFRTNTKSFGANPLDSKGNYTE